MSILTLISREAEAEKVEKAEVGPDSSPLWAVEQVLRFRRRNWTYLDRLAWEWGPNNHWTGEHDTLGQTEPVVLWFSMHWICWGEHHGYLYGHKLQESTVTIEDNKVERQAVFIIAGEFKLFWTYRWKMIHPNSCLHFLTCTNSTHTVVILVWNRLRAVAINKHLRNLHHMLVYQRLLWILMFKKGSISGSAYFTYGLSSPVG